MRIRILFFFIICMIIFSCGSNIQTLKEPSSDRTFLVIGAVALEDNYYTQFGGVHLEDIEVAILSETISKGEIKLSGHWARTDENGFFVLSDVARGRYTITGIRLYLSNGDLIVLSNPLNSGKSEFVIQEGDHVPFVGQYFKIEPQGRLVNLQNNLFIIDQESRTYYDVKHITQNSFSKRKMLDGSYLGMMSVEQYFLEKYPNSSWRTVIERIQGESSVK